MLNELREPRGKWVNYEPEGNEIVIGLRGGAVFWFPVEIAQGIAGAEPEVLALVELTSAGDGLRWDVLDADLSVPMLLAGRFGSREWMERLVAV
ncbi:MAG: DUF2442 domain-containing protein [Cyanophyceae cyanobacterium]